jgi:hypothetical protein
MVLNQRKTLLLFGFLIFSVAKGQITTPSQGFLFSPQFSVHQPIGDLADRFTNFGSIGLSTNYKFQNGLLAGLEYDWYFGDALKEIGTFSQITGPSGQILDQDGNYAVVRFGIRGHNATANLGYLINLKKKNPNSGILIQGGAGFLQHKVYIFSSVLKVPQINNEYLKGYDKLTYGVNFRQFIGYQYLVSRNRYHFKAGIEFNQGLTQGRRTWDFNANKSGLDERFDGSISFKAGIIVPVYTKKADDEEFFIN